MPVGDVQSLTGGPRIASAFARFTPGWIPVTSVPFSPFANFAAKHPVVTIDRTTRAESRREPMPLIPHAPRSCLGYILFMDSTPHVARPSILLSWSVYQ